ncbi:hypothetical protein [Amycolatopsis kentuckyensis]|uniref:hypothetical protein n=1 Tax=Amycolatopsis kentuckyensis TaxID=218823 RepID=UPI000A36CA4A|nr:hypothetical protein [Amycolatopsis kentuckyensis]
MPEARYFQMLRDEQPLGEVVDRGGLAPRGEGDEVGRAGVAGTGGCPLHLHGENLRQEDPLHRERRVFSEPVPVAVGDEHAGADQ